MPPRNDSDSDDLFSPTLQDRPAAMDRDKLPWRLASQFWVAFFGGVLAVTAIAYLNAKRLGVGRERLHMIIIGGVVAFVVLMGFSVFYLVYSYVPEERSRSISQVTRVVARVAAVLLFLVQYRIQTPADRAYQTFGKGEYASLWKPGLAAVFGLGILQAVIAGLLILPVAYHVVE